MKSVAIIIVLAVVGAGLALGFLRMRSSPNATPTTLPAPAGPSAPATTPAQDEHGGEISAADGAALCEKHRIPENKDAFCHPELVEALGFCGAHEVPEAFCTRCSPILIAAFKAENDWCAEHSLPESQCKICKGEVGG